MRRIITLTALALGLTGGVAAADRFHGPGGVVREHRDGGRFQRFERPSYNQRFSRGGTRVYINNDRGYRRPIYANRDNRFYFSAGVHRPYYRPVINYHYRTYAQRPTVIVENYDQVPGYIWIAGQWSWNGYEWVWLSGHYEADVSYDGAYDYPPGY